MSHIRDVNLCGTALIEEFKKSLKKHDHTKLEELDWFFNDFYDTQTKKIDFTRDGSWYDMHVSSERHHLNNHCPDDVNLLDVLEMICDCTTAGMARNGTFTEFKLLDEILQKALKNTVDLILDNMVLVKNDEKSVDI